MRVIITGHTGFIGSALAANLAADGHDVVGVSRSPATQGASAKHSSVDNVIVWDLEAGTIDKNAMEGADAIVHLAGESIEGRWTAAKKQRILNSRVRSTEVLADAIASLDSTPQVLVSGSAMGIYGNRRDEVLSEGSSTPGGSFLADVCLAWEAAAMPVASLGVRLVYARTGLVLGEGGGALKKMATITKFGAGGPLGRGDQWWSWITLDDEVRALRHVIDNEVEGPANIVGPTAVRQKDFARALGEILRRPTFMPAPAFAIKTILGEMGQALLLDSIRLVPQTLVDAGFEHQHPDLGAALKSMLQRS
jgi:uncharacterized protein